MNLGVPAEEGEVSLSSKTFHVEVVHPDQKLVTVHQKIEDQVVLLLHYLRYNCMCTTEIHHIFH